jgi:hypothetical protein
MEADQAHANARASLISMREANKTVLTTMSNLLANSQNAAFADAKYAAVEAMNLGKTKADVKAAAVPKVDTFFATQQKNLFNHFSVQAQTWVNIINSLEDTPNIGWDDVFIHPADGRNVDDGRPNDMGGKCQLATNSVTLVDGNDFTYNIAQWNYQNSGGYSKDSAVKPGGDPIKAFPVNTGSQTVVLDGPKWTSVRDSITSNHSNVVSEIETWIDGVYDSYNQGDIQLSELVDASTIADKAPDEQGYSYAGADLALMGLEGADHAYSIELMESGEVVQGTIYAQSRTDPLELGTVYSPGSISGTVWLAYETTDDSGNTVSDLVALEQNFQVLDGKNSEGESVTEVTFSPKNQQTTDTNVTNVTKELQQLQELQDELRKQQQQEVSSGGGGMSLDQFSIGGIPGAGVVAIFLGGALWLFGQDDN